MANMDTDVSKLVEEYIAAQPEAVRSKLEKVRAAIKKTVPEALEVFGYRMPGFKLHGKPLLYFASFKEHYSLFAASPTFFAELGTSSKAMTCEREQSISHSISPFQ